MHELWDIDQAAQRLGTSVRHVRRMVHERRIPYVKVGHFVRFDAVELARWLDDHRVAMRQLGVVRAARPERRSA